MTLDEVTEMLMTVKENIAQFNIKMEQMNKKMADESTKITELVDAVKAMVKSPHPELDKLLKRQSNGR